MRAATSSRSLATASALQMALNRRKHLLLALLVGDVERGEAAFGEPDVSDDLAVGAVVEVKEVLRLIPERGGSYFAQLAEVA